MGHLDAILHGHARNRHKGTHVGGAHAGMLTAVFGHVDEFAGLFDQAKRRLAHRLRRPHKRDDCAVGALSGIDVKQSASFHRLDHSGHGVDDFGATSLADVGDAFNQALHGAKVAPPVPTRLGLTPPRFPR